MQMKYIVFIFYLFTYTFSLYSPYILTNKVLLYINMC